MSARDEVVDGARFLELTRAGDQARAAGRLADAAIAYRQALALREDPTIEGRLGLIAAEVGRPAMASHALLRAMRGGGGASDEEQRQFAEAFRKARARVCLLEVEVETPGASVTIDGVAVQGGVFEMFVEPGSHEVRARLDGYEDAEREIVAEPGKIVSIKLRLRPIRIIAVQPAAPGGSSAGSGTARKPAARPSSRLLHASPRFAFAVGAVGVVGSTPGHVAPGAVASFGVQWLPLSVAVEVRAAWAVETLPQFPSLRPWALALSAPACGHWPAGTFLCALVQVEGPAADYRHFAPHVVGGAGVRGGLDLPVRGVPFRVRISGETVLRSLAPGIDVVGVGRAVAWRGYLIGGAFGIAAAF